MWTLAIILLFLVFDKINDEHFLYLENYTQLLEMMAIVFSLKISMSSLSYLQSLIPSCLETYANI